MKVQLSNGLSEVRWPWVQSPALLVLSYKSSSKVPQHSVTVFVKRAQWCLPGQAAVRSGEVCYGAELGPGMGNTPTVRAPSAWETMAELSLVHSVNSKCQLCAHRGVGPEVAPRVRPRELRGSSLSCLVSEGQGEVGGGIEVGKEGPLGRGPAPAKVGRQEVVGPLWDMKGVCWGQEAWRGRLSPGSGGTPRMKARCYRGGFWRRRGWL